MGDFLFIRDVTIIGLFSRDVTIIRDDTIISNCHNTGLRILDAVTAYGTFYYAVFSSYCCINYGDMTLDID